MTNNNLPSISKSTREMTKLCESKYYTFHSSTYSVASASVNSTRYDVRAGDSSDSFKSRDLPATATLAACSCNGGSKSGSNTGLATGSFQTTSTQTSDTWTTSVVNSITTYCPSATEVTQGGKTYTVTEATTLTITDCPCAMSWTASE